MVDGLITSKEKPSNTEVLGLLMDEDKLKFITNLNGNNIKGLCKLSYITKRLADPNKDAVLIHNEVINDYLALKCSLKTNKGNRSDQIVDALKHLPEKEEETSTKLIDQIRK